MKSMLELARENAGIMAEWDRLFELQHMLVNPFEVLAIKERLTHYNIRRFVDVGCGAGDITTAFKDACGFQICALEPEPYFYKRTTDKFRNTGIELLNIPLAGYAKNHTADCLFFRFVVQHFPDKTSLCGDAFNILVPGGLAIIVESVVCQNNPPIKTYKEIGRRFVEFYGRGTAGDLEADTVKSFVGAGFMLVHRGLLQIPANSIPKKQVFGEMLFNAGLVKAMSSNQDLAIMDKLREELMILDSPAASVDYQDLLLIFQKDQNGQIHRKQ